MGRAKLHRRSTRAGGGDGKRESVGKPNWVIRRWRGKYSLRD